MSLKPQKIKILGERGYQVFSYNYKLQNVRGYFFNLMLSIFCKILRRQIFQWIIPEQVELENWKITSLSDALCLENQGLVYLIIDIDYLFSNYSRFVSQNQFSLQFSCFLFSEEFSSQKISYYFYSSLKNWPYTARLFYWGIS